MGYVVASNPLGQMLFSPLFGLWGNKTKSVRIPLLCSVAVFCMSSGLYSSLELFPSVNVKYWMFLSRFLVGVGSGKIGYTLKLLNVLIFFYVANVTLCRSYLSDATRLKERTGAVSMVSLAQVLGFIVGPALQAVVTPLGEAGYSLINGRLNLNMYTAAGWINMILALGNFCLFLPMFFQVIILFFVSIFTSHSMIRFCVAGASNIRQRNDGTAG